MTNKTTQELKEIRRGITEVDNKMALLFKERMTLVKKVGEYKKTNGLPIYDPAREAQVLQGGTERMDDPDLKSYSQKADSFPSYKTELSSIETTRIVR